MFIVVYGGMSGGNIGMSLDNVHNDIKAYQLLCKNASYFIKKKGLIPLPKYTTLPLSVYFGIVYLIKNNTIIEFNTSMTPDEIDYDNGHMGYHFNKKMEFSIVYKTTICFINIELADIATFQNTEQFLDKKEILSYKIDSTVNFIMALIKHGFVLYGSKIVSMGAK